MSQLPLHAILLAISSSASTTADQVIQLQQSTFTDILRAACRHINVHDPHYIAPMQSYDIAYWRQCLLYGNVQFKRHFRLTIDTFWRLHSKLFLSSYGEHGNAYHSDFKLGVFLYRMATKQTCRELAELFSVAQSTISRLTMEIGALIVNNLSSTYVTFPTRTADLCRISEDWEAMAGFPNVIGAIDGTQIDLVRGRRKRSGRSR
jgi:hypothetical protein